MIAAERRVAVIGWLWRLMLLLPLFSNVSATEKDSGKSLQVIQQRLTLASHILERMEGEHKAALGSELEGLQTRFLVNIDEALVVDSHVFFDKVVDAYRKSRPTRADTDVEVHRRRYEQKLKEVDAFHQSYMALIAERGEAARKMLDEERYIGRVDRARQMAKAQQYEDAYSLADGAYHQLITALHTLRDKETIEYRLEFATPAEEYAYEIRRFESQRMLLDMIVAEKQPNASSMALIHSFVAEADAKRRTAQGLADTGEFAQAIDHQEQAVEELTKAMRLAGVYF